jgi:glycosyltransferase involved in cell wall biosynthesis
MATMRSPDLSILIAAHCLRREVPVAVASVFERATGAAVEVVVASDDGTDYAEVLPVDGRLRFTPVGPVASGAHAARNRALSVATGRHVLMLDGDDALEGPVDAIAGALAAVGPAGAVVVPSVVRDAMGQMVRRVPAAGVRHFGFNGWASAFASLHMIARRDLAPAFRPFRLIDDVLFDLTVLAAAGGVVPVAEGLAYRYQLRAGQATDTEGGRFDAEYARALGLIAADGAGFGRHAPAAAAVLRRWRAMNRLVGGGGSRPGLGDYHRAVRAYLADEWPAGSRMRAAP